MDMERKGLMCYVLEVGPASLSCGLGIDVTGFREEQVCGKVKPEPPGNLR